MTKGGGERGIRTLSVRSHVQRFSRPPHSTTLPPLHGMPQCNELLCSTQSGGLRLVLFLPGSMNFCTCECNKALPTFVVAASFGLHFEPHLCALDQRYRGQLIFATIHALLLSSYLNLSVVLDERIELPINHYE